MKFLGCRTCVLFQTFFFLLRISCQLVSFQVLVTVHVKSMPDWDLYTTSRLVRYTSRALQILFNKCCRRWGMVHFYMQNSFRNHCLLLASIPKSTVNWRSFYRFEIVQYLSLLQDIRYLSETSNGTLLTYLAILVSMWLFYLEFQCRIDWMAYLSFVCSRPWILIMIHSSMITAMWGGCFGNGYCHSCTLASRSTSSRTLVKPLLGHVPCNLW